MIRSAREKEVRERREEKVYERESVCGQTEWKSKRERERGSMYGWSMEQERDKAGEGES